MNINWKLRLKNKTVLTGIVSAILLFVKQITELFGIDIGNQLEQLSGVIGSILALLTGIGVLVDPTTKGTSDSGISKTYTNPRDEDKQPVDYQRDETPLKEQIGIMTPKVYDTSQPFTDDSDEVEFDVAEYEDTEELLRGQSKYHDDKVLGLDKEVK
ncbi:phage holin [Staphylococcus shinii]|uniref:phage holin n=1 Tax=Staphylococcus shinii TaxID=2912228 RepID=UPI000C328163|nr:phage holin [Staphylococcus shinii]PKI10987.1 phage holin [Staphylococcus shinii]